MSLTHSLSSVQTGKSKHDDYDLELLEVTATRGSDDAAVENKATLPFVMTMVGFSMAFVVAEITPLFLITSFTIIALDFNQLNNLIWLILAPFISTGAVAPFTGALSDVIGRKAIVLSSLGVAIIAFALTGATPNFIGLMVGLSLSGAAIGVMLLTIVSAASELVPVSKRGQTIGFLVIGVLPFGGAPVYGQLLAEKSWRYIFVVLGGWASIAFVILAIFYKPPPRKASIGLTKTDILKRLDYLGALLLIAGLVIFLIGLNWGGETYPWKSWQVLGAMGVGVFLFALFGIWEIKFVRYPMFPAALITNKRLFFAVSMLAFTSGINFVPLTVFWTLQVFAVYQASFEQAGIWLLPVGFCIMGGAMIAAMLITVARRHVMWVLLFFSAMQTAGIGTMSLADSESINSIWAPMIFGLIGVGAVLLPSQVVFSVISPDELIGTSVALSVMIRMAGQVIGKATFYNIFRNMLTSRAPAAIGVQAVEAGFTNATRITDFVTTMASGPITHYAYLFPEIKSTQDLQTLIVAGQKLYASIFPTLYLISVPFGGAACLSCLLLYGIHKYMDNHVAVHL